jgi:hypothetical protein
MTCPRNDGSGARRNQEKTDLTRGQQARRQKPVFEPANKVRYARVTALVVAPWHPPSHTHRHARTKEKQRKKEWVSRRTRRKRRETARNNGTGRWPCGKIYTLHAAHGLYSVRLPCLDLMAQIRKVGLSDPFSK